MKTDYEKQVECDETFEKIRNYVQNIYDKYGYDKMVEYVIFLKKMNIIKYYKIERYNQTINYSTSIECDYNLFNRLMKIEKIKNK